MKVILFGATGMVGQGVLRECLHEDAVTQVLSIGRTALNQPHPRLQELLRKDLLDYSGLDDDLTGFDACFFCLGVSSGGMTEADYTRLTYDLTLAAAETLARLNPAMTFIYVSGVGTDSTEHGRSMWARVKGRTENALQRLPFKAVYLFRPGIIQPLDGITSKTTSYRVLYTLTTPLLGAARRLFPRQLLTTAQIGRAMLHVARHGAPQPILEPPDLYAAATAHTAPPQGATP